MVVGDAARLTGLPVRTIHYYEQIALVVPSRRSNGYRDYDDKDVQKLRFVQRARALGFTIEECRALLGLYADRHRASADVKVLAQGKIGEIDRKVAELHELRATLMALVTACHGDDRPDCPILAGLAGDP